MDNVIEGCYLRFLIPIANVIMEKGVKEGCENLVFKDMGDDTAEITTDPDTADKILFWEFNSHSYY